MDRCITIPKQYEPQEILAQGPLSTLARAIDKSTGEQVALKLYHIPDWMTPAEGREHLARIAEAANARVGFTHENVASVLEVIEQEDSLVVARQFVEGVSLAEHVARFGLLEPGEVRRIAAQAGAAMDALKSARFSHGSLTAQNILLSSAGSVRLTDSGITAAAMQFRLAGIRCRYNVPRSDLHALAAVLYEAMTGWRPGDRRVLKSTCAALPKPLRSALLRALASERPAYCSAAAFASAMDASSASATELLQTVWRPAAAVGLLGSLATVGGNAVSESRDLSHHSTQPSHVTRIARVAPTGVAGLSAEDRQALRQAIRLHGVATLRNPAVADFLGLSEIQRGIIDDCLVRYKEHVGDIVEASADGMKIAPDNTMAGLRHQTEARVLFLLTPAQRSWWDQLNAE